MYPTTNENIIEFISKLAKNFNKFMGRLHRISMNNVSSNVKDNLNNSPKSGSFKRQGKDGGKKSSYPNKSN